MILITGSASAQQALPPQVVTVSFLTQGEPETLDPNRVSPARAVDAAVVRQLFEPLLRFDEKLIPQPAAAESYEVSLDGTVYRFHLRQDARWSDGQPVTASQFEYAWKRLLDPAVHSDYAALFVDAGIVGSDDFNSGRARTAAKVGITAVDDRTLEVRLVQPFGALPDLAALWVGAPVRQDVVAGNPDGWAQDPMSVVGNGPFMLADWVHQDHLTLVPNPQYGAHLSWPAPTLQRVTIQMGASPEAELAAYAAGRRDWILVPDMDVNQVLNDPVLAGQSRQYNELTTFWVQINNARPPLDTALVRRALSKAVDRASLVRDLTTGVSLPATSIIPPGMPGSQEDLGRELGFDVAGARDLLSQAGFSGGQGLPKLAFSFPDEAGNLARARYLQSQWETNLGLDVQLNPMDPAAYQEAIDAKDYDLAFGGWAADYPDPQDWFALVFGCQGAFNKVEYCNPAFDQLVAKADTAATLNDRLGLYAKAQAVLLQDVPVAPLFVRGRLALVKPWVQTADGGPLPITPLDEYPGSLFLDKVQILQH